MMAKATGRRKEIAVRLSLGAGRVRLIRQLLTESILLSIIGGVAGLVVAVWGMDLIWSMRPSFIGQNMFEPVIDARVLVFTLLVSVVTGAIFGLLPAIQSSRPRVVDALKEESRAGGRSRGASFVRNTLVVVQVMLSIVVLVAAGLFLRSLSSAHEIDPGFETEKLAVVTVNPGQAGYDQPRAEQFYDRIVERLRTEPMVRSAAWATNAPLFGGFQRTVYLEGQPRDDGARIFVTVNNIEDGYFETIAPLFEEAVISRRPTATTPFPWRSSTRPWSSSSFRRLIQSGNAFSFTETISSARSSGLSRPRNTSRSVKIPEL